MDINPFTIANVLRDIDPLTPHEQIIEKIIRIDSGFSGEDEFQAMLLWLGKCILCQKIENDIITSKKNILSVPDLLAVFENENDQKIRVTIEVKTNNENKLDWKPSYFNGFREYERITGLPVLVAWKHKNMNVWTLNTLSSFKKKQNNYHLSEEDSYKENVLGILGGDIGFQLCDNVGLHIEMNKIESLSTENDKNIWKTLITRAWFTDTFGNENTKLPDGMWELFISSDISEKQRISGDSIIIDFIYDQNEPETSGFQFLHRALPIIISSFKEDYNIPWREVIKTNMLPISANNLKKSLTESIGFYTYMVFNQIPQTVPDFIKCAD